MGLVYRFYYDLYKVIIGGIVDCYVCVWNVEMGEEIFVIDLIIFFFIGIGVSVFVVNGGKFVIGICGEDFGFVCF